MNNDEIMNAIQNMSATEMLELVQAGQASVNVNQNGNGNNIIFSQTVPAYEDTTLKIAREYLKLLKFYYPKAKPTYASFESFLAANLVVRALQRTKNNITRKNFLYELKHLPKDILGKIPIHYKHTQLLNRVYLSTYENGKFKLLKKYIK